MLTGTKKVWGALAAAGALLFGAASASAQPSYDGETKEEILLASWDTGSRVEKTARRAYLKDNFPGTPEAMFAEAWFATDRGQREEAAKLYLECLDAAPEFHWCLSNYVLVMPSGDRSAIERARGLFAAMSGPGRFDSSVFQNIYNAYRNLPEPALDEAEAFFAEYAPQLEAAGKGWKVPYIRGIWAQLDKRYDEAIALFDESIALGADNFNVWSRQADARRAKITPAKLQRERTSRNEVLTPLIEYSNSNPRDFNSITYLGDFLINLKAQDQAARRYEAAFLRTRNPEFLSLVRRTTRYPSRQSQILDLAIGLLPDDPYVKSELAFHTIDYDVDVDEGRRLFNEALPNLPDGSIRRRVASDFARLIEDYAWDWDLAYDLRQKYLPENDERLRWQKRNRFRAGDLTGAQHYLDKVVEAGAANETYIEAYRGRIERARVDAKALEVAADYLDFLDRWSGAVAPRTGAADKIVAFERGSSELVPLQQAAVAAMGEKLRAGSEIVDVVEVAGFAAPDESEDADQLARDRAAAVKALLIETSGLSGDKFALVGSTRPTAVEGVAGGNRATVTPLADYGEQQIIAPVGRANYTTGLSPDGRFALIGQSPRILDLATGRVRGQLGRGTSPKYSPNGRMIAMRSNWNETGDHESRALFIYDSVTGLILHQIAFDSQKMTTAEAYTWSPDSTALAFITDGGEIYRYDLKTRKAVWSARHHDRLIGGRIQWSPNGKLIALGFPYGRAIVLIDAETGKLVDRLAGGTWSRAMAWSPDGRYVVSADDQLRLYRWDIANGSRREMRLPYHPNRYLKIDHTGKIALLDVGTRVSDDDNTRQILKIDLEAMQLTGSVKLDRQNFAFSQDASHILLGRDDLQLVRTSDLTLVEQEVLPSTGLDFSIAPEGCACVVTKDADGVHVWDAATGRKRHSFAEQADSLTSHPGGNAMIGLVEDRLIRFDLVDFTAEDWGPAFDGDGKAQLVRADGDILAIGGVLAENRDLAITEIRRLSDRTFINRISFQVVTETRQFGGTFLTRLSGLDVDAERRQIVVLTRWREHMKYPAKHAREARVFDIDSGALAHRLRPNRDIDSAKFSSWNGQSAIRLVRGPFVSIYNADGEFLENIDYAENAEAFERNGRDFTVARVGTRIVEVDWTGGEGEPVRIDAGDNLKHFHTLPDLNLLVATRSDNSFTFHNLETGERVLTIAALRDSEWLAYTESGLYASSLNGAAKASLAFGSVVRPLEAYVGRLESRQFVAEKLASVRTGTVGEKLAEAEVQARSSGFSAPYVLSLISPAAQKTATSSLALDFEIIKTAPDAPDPVLELTINNDKTLVFETAGKISPEGVFSPTLALNAGPNMVLASIKHRNERHSTVGAFVERTTGARAADGTEEEIKPRLFFLGVGVSTYADSRMNLKFAHRDVLEVEKLLLSQKGKLFSDVRTLVLTDEKADNERIRIEGLRQLFRAANSSTDIIVIYLAGHGAQDVDQSLYFLTHNARFDDPVYGFDMQYLANFLDNRPDGQKLILFMDMCKSGSLDMFGEGARTAMLGGSPRITLDDMENKLKGSGTLIFASSTGSAPSYESADWDGGHGAFTAAVLRALKGQADSKNGEEADGLITVPELTTYVMEAVPQITGDRKQQPTILKAKSFSPYALSQTE